ncbi:MAG: hypothetical protein ABFC77_03045 [Thermoguttaceae bacterium]
MLGRISDIRRRFSLYTMNDEIRDFSNDSLTRSIKDRDRDAAFRHLDESQQASQDLEVDITSIASACRDLAPIVTEAGYDPTPLLKLAAAADGRLLRGAERVNAFKASWPDVQALLDRIEICATGGQGDYDKKGKTTIEIEEKLGHCKRSNATLHRRWPTNDPAVVKAVGF